MKHAATMPSSKLLFEMLHHLGWSLGALSSEQTLSFGKPRRERARWQTMALPDGQYLLLVHLDEQLPDGGESYKAYEDFTPFHRALFSAVSQEKIRARHMLLFDDKMNVQIIDLAQEDILVRASGQREITELALPVLGLQALARGSLTSHPRKSLGHRARELADWTRLWGSRLGASSAGSKSTARQFLFWMHLARLVENLELTPPRKLPFDAYIHARKQPHPARYLMDFFRPLKDEWNLLQGATLSQQQQIANGAHADGQLAECLSSYGLLSSSKFSSEVFAEAFADEELRLIGWRQALIARDERAAEDPARWFTTRAIVDIDEVGLGSMMHRFDQIVDDLRRLAREQAVQREHGQRPGMQADLLGHEPLPEFAEEDAPRLATQMAMEIRTSERDRAETARIVLLARAAEWHARLLRPRPIFATPRIVVTPADAPPPPPPPANPYNASLN